MRKILHDLRSPYSYIRNHFDSANGTTFTSCLAEAAQSFQTWMSFEQLKRLQLFDWDPPSKLSLPVSTLPMECQQILADAQLIRDIGMWVFTLAIVFPQTLQNHRKGQYTPLLSKELLQNVSYIFNLTLKHSQKTIVKIFKK